MFLFSWPQTGTDHLQYWLSIHLVCLSDVKKQKKLISTIERKFQNTCKVLGFHKPDTSESRRLIKVTLCLF